MKPKEILLQFVDAFNRADAEKISSLYALDAVSHQVANEPVIGKAAIKEMFEAEFSQAKMTLSSRISSKTATGQSWNGKIHWA